MVDADRRGRFTSETNAVSLWAMPVYRITQLGLVNAYLVQEDDGLTLIDTLLPRGQKRILAAAETLGAPIVRIALTHAHGDHIGSLDALAAALPGVEVLISARDARLLAKDKTLDPGEPAGASCAAATRARRRGRRATFAAGDRVGSLEVHAAPGHTPGQVAFLDPRDGTLYCADAYSTLGGVATTAKRELALPAAGLGDLAPPDRAGDRAGAARARPAAARARPRQGGRGARRRDGPRDRARGLSVAAPRPRPRAGRRRRRRHRRRRRARGGDARARRRSARRALAVALQPRRRPRRAAARARRAVDARARRRAAARRDRARRRRRASPPSPRPSATTRSRTRGATRPPSPRRRAGDAEHEAAAADAVDVLAAVLGGCGLEGDDADPRGARAAQRRARLRRARGGRRLRPRRSTATRRSAAWSTRSRAG